MPTLHYRFHTHLSKKKRMTMFDTLASVAALLYPLSGLPQVTMVFHGSTSGVSVASWAAFMVFSTLFLVYGVVHKLKPLIITNSLWLVIDLCIIIGTLTHRIVH